MEDAKTANGFNKFTPAWERNEAIANVNQEANEYNRIYQKQNIVQTTKLEGANRVIIQNDGTNNRLIIGYYKGLF